MGEIRTRKLKIFADGTMHSVVCDFKEREREGVREKGKKRENRTKKIAGNWGREPERKEMV